MIPTQTIIEQAIGNMQCLQVFYGGGYRIIEPYCLGINTNGYLALRCWQRGGVSSSGKPTGWKIMLVNMMGSIEPLATTFSQHPEYRRGDKAMATIIAQV